MVNQGIINWVRSQQALGRSLDAIRQGLLMQGYRPQEIEEALRALVPQESKPKGLTLDFKDYRLWLIIAGIVVVLGILVWYFFFRGGTVPPVQTTEETLSLEINDMPDQINEGDSLTFSVMLISDNKDKEYPLKLQTGVTSESGRSFSSLTSEESTTLKAEEPIQKSIGTTKLPGGTYGVFASATYQGETFTVNKTFEVATLNKSSITPLKNDTALLSCQTGCDDHNKCTKDSCTNNQCVFEPQTPCCGNFICETGENNVTCPEDCKIVVIIANKTSDSDLIMMAVKKANVSAQQSLQMCALIQNQYNRDVCYGNAVIAAPSAAKLAFCNSIVDQTRKDYCYSAIATKTINVCDKISDTLLKESCNMQISIKKN